MYIFGRDKWSCLWVLMSKIGHFYRKIRVLIHLQTQIFFFALSLCCLKQVTIRTTKLYMYKYMCFSIYFMELQMGPQLIRLAGWNAKNLPIITHLFFSMLLSVHSQQLFKLHLSFVILIPISSLYKYTWIPREVIYYLPHFP